MDGKRVRAVACGSTHTACLVTRAWVSDDLIKNCMACKSRFSLVNRKVRVIELLSIVSHETRGEGYSRHFRIGVCGKGSYTVTLFRKENSKINTLFKVRTRQNDTLFKGKTITNICVNRSFSFPSFL